MNDDDFEKKLLALTGALRGPDPTPAWKAAILGRARREAESIPDTHGTPPRWLLLSWAAAWTAILALHFSMPRDPAPGVARVAHAAPAKVPAAIAEGADASPQTLFAFHQHLNLNLDLP